ncbi:Bug family tripartite tricarboxylate transporter substrate binding protein [Variovorax fucosicus]|uniref:Bug family tripartite tricarboxylate transporter substrate binding protein n=1 Tax=Variovorax fucosicus TaxID=3053517 RepID=UPI0025789559|nr:tripartite tricarboxylate transporter substrate binding protein [Variovorax sp. J22G47]MDM0059145.1 tripartite tricarboxylate transporter substrate binding protein [Variovorax sp. J22G47]
MTLLGRRTFIGGIGGLLLSSVSAAEVIRVVVPYAAGGITDIGARIICEQLGQVLGQSVIVENRPGGGTRIGTSTVFAAKPDGNTLLLTNIAYSILPLVDPAVKYDAVRAAAPVGIASVYPIAIVVNAALPVKTLGEFVAYARKNPGKLSYGSAGPGSGAHLGGELFKALTGTYLVHIPYRSTASALTEVAAGRIDLTFDATAIELAKTGKVRILAVSGTERDPRMPDVPTVAEAGLKGMETSSWLGLFAPLGTPPPVIERLNQALNVAVQNEGLKARFRELGMLPRSGPPSLLIDQVRHDTQLYQRVIQEAKLKFE